MSRTEIDLIRAWLMTRLAAMRNVDSEDHDRGSISLEWAIAGAILAAIAIAVGGIFLAKALSKANEINLQ